MAQSDTPIPMTVTQRDQIRDATGTFGCPSCWPRHLVGLVPGTTPCPNCGVALDWPPETFQIYEQWAETRRRRDASDPHARRTGMPSPREHALMTAIQEQPNTPTRHPAANASETPLAPADRRDDEVNLLCVLRDMQVASDNMDIAYGTSDYESAAVILALLARQLLREWQRLGAPPPRNAVDPSAQSSGTP